MLGTFSTVVWGVNLRMMFLPGATITEMDLALLERLWKSPATTFSMSLISAWHFRHFLLAITSAQAGPAKAKEAIIPVANNTASQDVRLKAFVIMRIPPWLILGTCRSGCQLRPGL